MAATLEKIYEVALHHYHMKLVAGRGGLSNLVDWVHVVEEVDYVHFLKGRELIVATGIKEPDDAGLLEFTRREQADWCLMLDGILNMCQKKYRNLARRCFLHRNTVTYHLKKISEITGKNLGETRNRTQWELAYLIRNLRKLLE